MSCARRREWTSLTAETKGFGSESESERELRGPRHNQSIIMQLLHVAGLLLILNLGLSYAFLGKCMISGSIVMRDAG